VRVLALAVWIFAALAPSLAAQDAGVSPSCEIRGHLSIAALHVVGPRGVVSVMSIDDRDVRVTPLGRGFFRVRTHGPGSRIDGRTEEPVPLSLARETTFSGIATVAAGTGVDEIEPHADAFVGTLSVHDGVLLRNVPLTCPELSATLGTDARLDSVYTPRGPVWRARVWRFRLRPSPDDESPPILIELTPQARAAIAWIEGNRHESWVEVRAALAHARLVGWARDTDLTLP